MSAATVDLAPPAREQAPASTIVIKAVMAITGLILFAYVVAHLLGNLQIFLPNAKEDLRVYSALLHRSAALLWTARLILLAAVLAHIWSYMLLAARKLKARPVQYARKTSVGSTIAARTMYWSGPVIALFVIYHVLHLTTGTVHPEYLEGDPYDNIVIGFKSIPVAIAYIVAMILLCMHLYHGAWSWMQSLGFYHPRYTPWVKRLAAVFSILIAIGFVSIPVAVITGWIQ